MSLKLKKVSKKEFEKFLINYPNKLDIDICNISEPPYISFNDFSIGKYPHSTVASTFLYYDNPEEYLYEPESKREYKILTKGDYKKVLKGEVIEESEAKTHWEHYPNITLTLKGETTNETVDYTYKSTEL